MGSNPIGAAILKSSNHERIDMDTLKTIAKWISSFILIIFGFALLKPYGVLFAGLACFMCAWIIIMGVGPTKSFLEMRVDSLERVIQNKIFRKI